MTLRHLVVSCCLLITFYASFAQKKEVKLLFAGDAMQHMPQVEAARSKKGIFRYDDCFDLIKSRISNADIACVNFETVLAGKPYTGYPTFSTPDEFALALRDVGFDLFVQANNHAADKGSKGLNRTINVLDSFGIKHTGTFSSSENRSLQYPLILIRNGIRMAFLNYVYDTNGIEVKPPSIVNLIDTVQMKKDIEMANLYHPDIIIAVMHWGEEYQTYPTSEQLNLAEFLKRNGVRIVIGHHPHVIQPILTDSSRNRINNVVFFSLGNFISNQQKPNTNGGMIAEITISKAGDNSPVVIDSVQYSLVWVRQFFENKKKQYLLIPTDLSLEQIHPAMNPAEIQKMNAFTSNARQILNHRIH
jgi:poly-gamma-glutamate synthesis protein (capsule biosynthesis protein)